MAFSISQAGVRDIARLVAEGHVAATTVAESVLNRIGEIEGSIQAFSQFDADLVRDQAAQLDHEATTDRRRGPLHGVPVAIKEWFNVRGFPTLMKGPNAPVEDVDATVVARLREAGAIIVGKTHVPIGNVNPPTRNPWSLEHSPGGSSSGSGAAVAARMVPISVGEQTGGSNLRPAAYCGVGALKPTYGSVSRFGVYPGAWSRDHPGLIGLDMADIALVFGVIAGVDARDPSTFDLPAYERGGSDGAPRIGVIRNFFPEKTQQVMQDAVDRSMEQLVGAGASVQDVLLPSEFGVVWDALEMTRVEGATFNAERWAAGGTVTLSDVAIKSTTSTRAVPRAAELVPATYYVQARRIRTWLSRVVTDLMQRQGVDALLLAATPGPAPRIDESTGDPLLLTPWSFLGFPAITISAGLSPQGLPLGLQLVAVPRHDYNLMSVGCWCEKALGLLRTPPPPTP